MFSCSFQIRSDARWMTSHCGVAFYVPSPRRLRMLHILIVCFIFCEMPLHTFGPLWYHVCFLLTWSTYIFFMLAFSQLCPWRICLRAHGVVQILSICENANKGDMGLSQFIPGALKYSARSGKALWGKWQFSCYPGVGQGSKARSRRRSTCRCWRSVQAGAENGSGAGRKGASGVRLEQPAGPTVGWPSKTLEPF